MKKLTIFIIAILLSASALAVFPSSPYLKIGGTTVWTSSGSFDGDEEIDFTSELKDKLGLCSANSQGNCRIKVTFGSALRGKLLLDNLRIQYSGQEQNACHSTCSSDNQCNDNDPSTTDSCINPGTCDSECANNACSVKCSNNVDCDDGKIFTIDNCKQAGTCNSYCESASCQVNCNSNNDCSDGNPSTTDTCLDAGNCNSRCSNTNCQVDCLKDSDCNDGNFGTTDICFKPGTCNAQCANEQCSVKCMDNSQCDDGNSKTLDICVDPTLCSSKCEYKTVASKPDLVAREVKYLRKVGIKTYVGMTISNDGTESAHNYKYTLKMGSFEFTSDPLGELEAGNKAYAIAKFNNVPSGRYTLIGIADTDNNVDEIDETNNEMSVEINI